MIRHNPLTGRFRQPHRQFDRPSRVRWPDRCGLVKRRVVGQDRDHGLFPGQRFLDRLSPLKLGSTPFRQPFKLVQVGRVSFDAQRIGRPRPHAGLDVGVDLPANVRVGVVDEIPVGVVQCRPQREASEATGSGEGAVEFSPEGDGDCSEVDEFSPSFPTRFPVR